MIDHFTQELSSYLQGLSLLAYVAVYLGGVLVSFTPCVYPVAPITIAFIGAHSSGSKRKGFVLSIIYVLGISVTYTALGAIAALSGKLFGQIQTNPWTYMIMANICILMGLAMLDVYVLPWRTPQSIARIQPREKTKGIISSFLIGMASGLVMGPCTAPVLAVLLGYVATQQNLFFAATLLFVFAFGLGTFLIILGTFAGLLANLPRSGPWMVRITHLFGWILIGTGEYFLIQSGILWG
jgi:cytochrome c-type biogenesis protein